MSFDREKEQLILALDLARIGFYDWNVVEDSIVYSSQMCKDWGIDNTKGMPLTEAIKRIHPDDQTRVEKLVYEAMEKHLPYSTEYRVVRPDGETVWLEVNGIVQYNNENQPVRFFGTSLNITVRKLREQLLENSEEMIGTFADTMPQMSFIADASGSIVHFNKRWYEYISAEGTEGWGWKDKPIHHPDDLDRTIKAWKHAVATGSLYEIDYRLLRHDGEYRWHLGRAFPFRNKAGEIIRWYGTNTDIHEERMSLERNRILYDFGFALSKGLSPAEIAETILREGRKILKSAAGLVLFKHEEGFKVAASHNISEEYFRNPNFVEAGARTPGKAALFENRAYFLEKRFEVVKEFPALKEMLDVSINSLVSLPLQSQGEAIASVVFFIEESSIFTSESKRFLETLASQAAVAVERAQLYELQENQKMELEDALKSRDEFFSIASHELKTPLTSMRLGGQILLKRLEKKMATEKSILEFAQQNDRSVSKLVRLVDDMLDMSRIRTGRMSLRKESFDLCELVNDIFQKVEESGDLKVNMEPCIPLTGLWDKLRIEQVVTNLITNAIRYGDKAPVHASLRKDGNSALLMIRDEGPGIDPALLEVIFNRYQRGPTGDVQGLGLGLYICRHIIESHGGKIWAESKLGSGSRFFVELPLL